MHVDDSDGGERRGLTAGAAIAQAASSSGQLQVCVHHGGGISWWSLAVKPPRPRPSMFTIFLWPLATSLNLLEL